MDFEQIGLEHLNVQGMSTCIICSLKVELKIDKIIRYYKDMSIAFYKNVLCKLEIITVFELHTGNKMSLMKERKKIRNKYIEFNILTSL